MSHRLFLYDVVDVSIAIKELNFHLHVTSTSIAQRQGLLGDAGWSNS